MIGSTAAAHWIWESLLPVLMVRSSIVQRDSREAWNQSVLEGSEHLESLPVGLAVRCQESHSISALVRSLDVLRSDYDVGYGDISSFRP